MTDTEGWNELDQASVRKSLGEMIRSMPDDYRGRVEALKQLSAIVSAEVADEFAKDISSLFEESPKATHDDATRLAEIVTRDLESFGLAIAMPGTQVAARLKVASTPPAETDQGWLQLEPMDRAAGLTKPFRIPRPYLQRFTLVPLPNTLRQIGGGWSR